MNDINPIMVVKGLGYACLRLFQDSLHIERKGWRAFLFQGTTGNIDIKLSSINNIQINKTSFRHHYMRFSFVNGVKNKSLEVYFRDENSLRFRAKQQPAFEVIRVVIENSKSTGNLN